MAQQRAELPVGSLRGREGGRWYNERPNSEAVAEWFAKNVKLHDDMEHERYVGGLTLISQTETAQEVRDNRIVKVKNLVYTPYGKVESRVQYFWDLMMAHPEWSGSILPVDPVGKDKQKDGDLPPGFYRINAKVAEKHFAYVACCMKVRVVERESKGGRNNIVIESPPATKIIPVLTTTGYGNNKSVVPDPYAMMKAETGAVGRALGLAGMLIIPGAGVATAEDMLEAQAQGDIPNAVVQTTVEDDALPGGDDADAADAVADNAEVLAAEATEKLALLATEKPEKHKEFQDWAKSRGFGPLEGLTEHQLRGIVRRLDKDLRPVAEK